jgi:glycosyltransferase involved in cell wall biosynthesis
MPDATTRLFIVDQTLKDFQGRHFAYDAAIAEAAEAAGLRAVVAANRKYEPVGTEASEVIPWFQSTWRDSDADAQPAPTFWSETLELLQSRSATPDDIVLIHTVSFTEFEEIVDFYAQLLWRDVALLPTVFVILRRDPDECAKPLLKALNAKLRRLYKIPDLCDRLRLCADTDQLCEGWRDALGQPILTLPIPFRHAFVDRLERPRNPQAPLQVVYLGDARNEKGYQHLPGMAHALWKDFIHPGRVEITLQSNYNLPGGEGGIPQARLKLQRFPHEVALITEPLAPEAYYAVLAKADIVVLPYDPQTYARRSSGVLNEAIAAGKVAVAPEGTWLAAQLDEERGVVYRHPAGLADAVIAAIERFPALACGAAAYRQSYRNKQNPTRFVQALLQNRRGVEPAPSGAILYVMDGDGIVNRTGAGSVARQQMQALIALGYRIHAVFQRIHVDERHDIDAMRVWMDAIREEVRSLKLASVWGAGHTPFYGHVGLMSERRILRERCLRLDADAHYRAASAIPAGLIETLREDPPRFAMVNYAQSIPFARMLAGTRTPVLAETHDTQSFQIALRNPKGFQQADLDLELKLLGEARHVVALNQLESDFLAERLGRDRVSFIAQPISDGPATVSMLAGARDLDELLEKNCGSSHPAVHTRAEPAAEPNPTAYFRQAKSIDLLYVSSRHGPNLQGLQLFMHHVFYPRLLERGVTLAVAGAICEALGDLEGPQVLLAHSVKDLKPLYAAAKLVILPILDGAGSAIKTIEAMAFAKPVVATSFAMRGVDRSSEPYPVHDDWLEFGDRVLELLASPEKRLAASQAAFRLSLVNGNDGGYVHRLGRAIAATLGRPEAVSAAPPKAPTTAAPSGLVEWDDTIRRFNGLCADYLSRGYFTAANRDAYRDAPLDPGAAEQLFEIAFETFDSDWKPRSERSAKANFERFMALIEAAPTPRDAQPALDSPDILVPAGTTSRAIAFDGQGATKVIWRSADPWTDSKARPTGLICATLPSAPPGTILEQVYDLATAPANGAGPCVVAGGMHPREPIAGPPKRWTGPEAASTFVVAVSRRYDAELCLHVYDALEDAIYEQAWLEVDGVRLPTLKRRHESGRMLIALIPAAPEAAVDCLTIVLRVPRTLCPSSVFAGNNDVRRLGLSLGRLELRCQITSAPRIGPSLAGQTLANMREGTPPHVVNSGYRDLLGRDPDAVGYAQYVELLTKRRLSASKFFRVLIDSKEFKARHPAPGLTELFQRYLPAD